MYIWLYQKIVNYRRFAIYIARVGLKKQRNKSRKKRKDCKEKQTIWKRWKETNHQENRWLDGQEKKKWTGEEQAFLWVKKKGTGHEIRVRELDREGEWGDSCHVSRWLSSGTQRQTPFSNPIVSAGYCHPAPIRNPVNMHLIPSRNHTHSHTRTHTPTTSFLHTHPHAEFKPHTQLSYCQTLSCT